MKPSAVALVNSNAHVQLLQICIECLMFAMCYVNKDGYVIINTNSLNACTTYVKNKTFVKDTLRSYMQKQEMETKIKCLFNCVRRNLLSSYD